MESKGELQEKGQHSGKMAALTIGALGVVYGDIGTSPLYTMQECFHGHGLGFGRESVLGVCSLVFWAITLVVSVKYIGFVMRADNRGEGGILALLALIPDEPRTKRALTAVAVFAIAGASLLFGDGIITPAISVLSAVEGLGVAAPALGHYVVPLTVVILLCLFAVQRRGTGDVGKLFGPVMLVWFVTIGLLGAYHLARNPAILAALNPVHGIRLLTAHGFHGFALLGSIVLAVTGGEALYADMGHFGAAPIRRAWLLAVKPALVLCYFGQGAMVLGMAEPPARLFYAMVPQGPAIYAMIGLATLATVIASQALISGLFSLTSQAMQLDLLPRMRIRHTSHELEGQIYLPEINAWLGAACIAVVLTFKESSRLAAAYGIAVSGTMAVTSILFYFVARRAWNWPVLKALPLVLGFLVIDLSFFGANILKFVDGGYVPVLVGLLICLVMINWRRGRTYLENIARKRLPSPAEFLKKLGDAKGIRRPHGTGIFLVRTPDVIPLPLVRLTESLSVVPETVLLVTYKVRHVPYVGPSERDFVKSLGLGIHQIEIRAGFMENPNLPALLSACVEKHRLPVSLDEAVYYLGKETFLATHAGQMGAVAEKIFAFSSRNATSAVSHLNLPPRQVMEIGTQMDL
ncbi:MAG: Low affinity potassium transport system protein kup [Thermoanaerobaculia bacterium]|nr:Low affinity potassium transport system protein kup [Thermoanaerobaculia bacterium]